MEIGRKFKEARIACNLTQEQVARALFVSRQTISGWENGKTYPDIVSLIKFSDLCDISLDQLLKEDIDMINHLKDSTDAVKSARGLITAIFINIMVIAILLAIAVFLPGSAFVVAAVFCLAFCSTGWLLWQIVRRI